MHERTVTTYVNDIPLAKTDPVLGYVNNPGAIAHVVGPEFTVDYQITEQGFRDPAIHTVDAEPGVVRILLVGDSYTVGHGVQYEQSWPALVREYFKRDGKSVEIINAGVAGYSTTQEVLYLEQLLEKYHPQIAVIGFVTHDVATNRPIDESGAVANIAEGAAVSVGAEKKSSLHSVALLKRILISNDYLYSRVYVSTSRRKWYEVPPSDWLADQFEITRSLLARAAELCRQTDTDLVVLSMPQLFQVLVEAKGMNIEGLDVKNTDSVFTSFSKEERFTWIPALPDLAAEYAQDGEDLYYRMDGHFNSRGNKVFARTAYEAISAAVD